MELPISTKLRRADYDAMAPASKEYPGRNHPGLGEYLAERFVRPGGCIVDPMMGVGQMWLRARQRGFHVIGCDQVRRAVELANANLHGGAPVIRHARAEGWQPEELRRVDLVGFSPPYPKIHDAGKCATQVADVKRKGLHASQAFEGPPPDLPRVYANIARYHPRGPVAVILKNYIEAGREIDWLAEQADLLRGAGYPLFEIVWRKVPMGRYQNIKLKRDPATPVVRKEQVLIAWNL